VIPQGAQASDTEEAHGPQRPLPAVSSWQAGELCFDGPQRSPSRGLALRVTAGGARTWILQIRPAKGLPARRAKIGDGTPVRLERARSLTKEALCRIWDDAKRAKAAGRPQLLGEAADRWSAGIPCWRRQGRADHLRLPGLCDEAPVFPAQADAGLDRHGRRCRPSRRRCASPNQRGRARPAGQRQAVHRWQGRRQQGPWGAARHLRPRDCPRLVLGTFARSRHPTAQAQRLFLRSTLANGRTAS
jgi:hypothetical protein